MSDPRPPSVHSHRLVPVQKGPWNKRHPHGLEPVCPPLLAPRIVINAPALQQQHCKRVSCWLQLMAIPKALRSSACLSHLGLLPSSLERASLLLVVSLAALPHPPAVLISVIFHMITAARLWPSYRALLYGADKFWMTSDTSQRATYSAATGSTTLQPI